MRYLLLVLLLAFGLTSSVFAQTIAFPTDTFAWTVNEGLPAAQRFTHTHELDGVLRQGPIPISCIVHPSDAAKALCTTPVGAQTAGAHVLRVRLTDTINGQLVHSEFSAPFAFSMYVGPTAPTDVRIIPAGTAVTPKTTTTSPVNPGE